LVLSFPDPSRRRLFEDLFSLDKIRAKAINHPDFVFPSAGLVTSLSTRLPPFHTCMTISNGLINKRQNGKNIILLSLVARDSKPLTTLSLGSLSAIELSNAYTMGSLNSAITVFI